MKTRLHIFCARYGIDIHVGIATVIVLCITAFNYKDLYASDSDDSIYVSPDTSASNCSIKPNIKSLSKAIKTATPGTTIYLLPGIHKSAVNFVSGGEKNKPVTLTYVPKTEQCQAGGPLSAIVDCHPAITGDVNCIEINYSHIIIDGIEVKNASYNGIKIDGDQNGSMSRESYGNSGGYYERNYHVNGANNIIIRNNYVHHIGYDGLKIAHTNNILVLNNEIYKAGMTTESQGIDMVGVYDSVIRGNYVHDDSPYVMNKGFFDKGGSENILIENNTFKNIQSPEACLEIGGDTEWYNTRYTPARFSYDINKKILDNSSQNDTSNLIDSPSTYEASKMAESRNAIVRGNLMIGCDPALSFRNTYNARVYNNTIINSGHGQAWIKLWDDGNHEHTNVNLGFYNNLMYNNDRPLGRYGALQDKSAGESPSNLKGLVFTNNLLFSMEKMPELNIPSSVANKSRQIGENPRLTNDYQLNKTSPAIDNGADLISLGIVNERLKDSKGNIRPDGKGFDIGAFEFNK